MGSGHVIRTIINILYYVRSKDIFPRICQDDLNKQPYVHCQESMETKKAHQVMSYNNIHKFSCSER